MAVTPPLTHDPDAMERMTTARLVQLTTAGVSVVVELPVDALPRIVHWGARSVRCPTRSWAS